MQMEKNTSGSSLLRFFFGYQLSFKKSVGVPEITEDQFFEDFSCINQIQAKKRGQINKEVYSRKRGLCLPSAATAEISCLKVSNVEVEKDKLFKQLVKIAIHRSCKYGGLENEEFYSKQIFKKTDEDYYMFAELVKSENMIKHVLDISLVEARHLIGKDIEGTSDPYATIHIMSTKKGKDKDADNDNFNVTKVEFATLNPKWNESFTMSLSGSKADFKDEEVVVMLWDHDEEQSARAAVKELSKIKSVGGLGRYITQLAQTAVSNKNAHDFLGMVTVPIKSIPTNGLDEWFPLQQRTSKSKVSGEILLKLIVNSVDAGVQEERSKLFALHKQLFTFLLAHEGKRQHQGAIHMWGFRLPRESEIILEMHQHFAGLTLEHTTIAKWQAQCTHYIEIGGSEEVLIETMNELIECPDSILTTEEADELLLTLNSFGNYVRFLLSELPFVCSPHKKTDIKTLSDLVSGYLMLFKMDLWNPRQVTEETDVSKLLQTAATDLYAKVKAADNSNHQDMKSQLESMIRTVIRLHCEIESFSNEYRVIFKPCNFDVQLIVYETVISLLIEDVKKVMMAVNKSWSKVLPDASSVLISTFVLYNSINQLVQASDPTNDKAARLQHIFQNYFAELMRKWTHIVQNKLNSHAEKLVIMEKIQSDSTIDDSSLSAREIMRAVKNISKCWLDINAPICSQNGPIFQSLVSMLCTHIHSFTSQLVSLVVEMRYHATYDTQFDIQDEMLIAFNNMHLLKQLNMGLKEELKMKLWTCSYEKLQEIIQANDNALKEEEIAIAAGLADKMEPSIEKYVFELRKANPDVSASQVLGMLMDYLDSNIILISRMQDKGTLGNIVVNIWGKICMKLKDVVETKPELEEEHYERVGESLKFLKHHFQSNLGENGVPEEKLIAEPAFTQVLDTIDLQKMDTTELIIRHYKEQSEERGERSTGAGVIDLKLSLKERRDGKAILFAKLLGARELIALDTNGKSDPFIQLQVVPHHLFPDCELKQSTVKKSTLEPIYNEMFEFIIPQDQICNGVLVLTVFDYDFISANDFEGEAMVRLTDLPRNSEQHVKWTMALHRPKQDSIYKILAGRVNDKIATKFVEIRKKAMEAEEFKLADSGASSTTGSKVSLVQKHGSES
ncbi:BAI1-associated protein 3-like isoform X2 [Bolinopsis microptera]|uniref:BAI1-associated protein 3-like isoform X2 n=1 Tax=Bolinopsis microptera TaxID=2820187 RepID=UPI00307A1327